MTQPSVPTVTVITEIDISEFAARREADEQDFLNTHFSTREQSTCLRRRRPNHGLAARFAAREGLTRACLELGVLPPELPEHAEIIHDAFGAPKFRWSGPFEDEIRGVHSSLTLAHDGDVACAVVVLQRLNNDT